MAGEKDRILGGVKFRRIRGKIVPIRRRKLSDSVRKKYERQRRGAKAILGGVFGTAISIGVWSTYRGTKAMNRGLRRPWTTGNKKTGKIPFRRTKGLLVGKGALESKKLATISMKPQKNTWALKQIFKKGVHLKASGLASQGGRALVNRKNTGILMKPPKSTWASRQAFKKGHRLRSEGLAIGLVAAGTLGLLEYGRRNWVTYDILKDFK